MISVVIPTSGRSLRHLAQQLTAVAGQRDAPELEIVVADNAGCPGIGELCRRRWAVPVRSVDASDQPGSSHARNVAVTRTEARFVAFADDDDIVDDRWLAALAKEAEASPVVTGVQAAVPLTWEPDDPRPDTGWYHSTYRGLVVASGGNALFDRTVFRDVGGFDVTLPRRVDTDLSIRLSLQGIDVAVADGARLCYRARSGVRAHAAQAFGWGRADVDLLVRYGDRTSYFTRSVPNSARHAALATGRLAKAALTRGDLVEPVRTLATYAGRLRGSLAYRTLYV